MTEEQKPAPKYPKVCPECGGPTQVGSGCVACVICGWGYCG